MKKTIPPLFLLCMLYLPLAAQRDDVGSGRALRFDAIDDYVDLGNIYDDITLPLTISAWVYKEESSQYIYPLFVSQDNASLYNGFWFCLSATNLFFEYGDGRGDQNANFRRGKSATLQNSVNRWIYVTAVVKSASDIQLFANGSNLGGSFQGASSLPMASDYPGDVAKIGYLYTNGVIHRFKGMIDEIRLWNRALSETEIRENMCRRLAGDEAGLIGYWNFNGISGDKLLDQSPKGFDGTLKGSPERVYSGAPLGDESVFLYTHDWTGSSLSKDDLTARQITGDPAGVHIYRVNSIPSQTGGIDVAAIAKPYYGVFLADDADPATYELSFAGSNVCSWFERRDNSVPEWLRSQRFSGITDRIEIIPASEVSDFDVDLGPNVVICDQSSLLLEAVPDAVGKTVLWSTGERTQSIRVTSSGTYSVQVSEACKSDRDTITVVYRIPPPAIWLGADEELCSLPAARTLQVNLEAGDYDFTWQDGSKDKSFAVSEFGTYWLKVSNACGQSVDSISFTRKVYRNIEAYNFISPNNHDDRNQFFMLDEKLQGAHLVVFNRWGKSVFESTAYANNWDGDGLPAGVYFYIATSDCAPPLKGTLTVMR